MAEPKPFHETICSTLYRLGDGGGDEDLSPMSLEALAWLTEHSVVPKNHDTIASAFKNATARVCNNAVDLTGVLAHLKREKKRHAKKDAEKVAKDKLKSGGLEKKPDPARQGRWTVYHPNEKGELVMVGYDDDKGIHLNKEGYRLFSQN